MDILGILGTRGKLAASERAMSGVNGHSDTDFDNLGLKEWKRGSPKKKTNLGNTCTLTKSTSL